MFAHNIAPPVAKSPSSKGRTRGSSKKQGRVHKRLRAKEVADEDDARTEPDTDEREFGQVDPSLEALTMPLALSGHAPTPAARQAVSRVSAASGEQSSGEEEASSLDSPALEEPSIGSQGELRLPARSVSEAHEHNVQAVLDRAKAQGTSYSPYGSGKAPPAHLVEAVRAAGKMLAGVKGVHEVLAGRDEDGQTVVLVKADKGLTDDALERIPEQVNGVRTLVVLSYDLLPLRKAR